MENSLLGPSFLITAWWNQYPGKNCTGTWQRGENVGHLSLLNVIRRWGVLKFCSDTANQYLECMWSKWLKRRDFFVLESLFPSYLCLFYSKTQACVSPALDAGRAHSRRSMCISALKGWLWCNPESHPYRQTSGGWRERSSENWASHSLQAVRPVSYKPLQWTKAPHP